MFKIVRTLPVKTHLPLKAWVLAGLVTLFSIATSLTTNSTGSKFGNGTLRLGG
jgi:hypothetical protein